MSLRHPSAVEALACGLGCGARAVLRRAMLMTAAWVIGAFGCGFVLFAAFAALRLLVGTELSALGIGIALLVLAGLLARHARGLEAESAKGGNLPPDTPLPPTDPATMAVFTAAFVLGRRLADRWRG